MKIMFAAAALTLALTAVASGAGEEQNLDKRANDIIRQRCTGCHGEERVKAAFKAGQDMKAIRRVMQGRGAKLSPAEQDILDTYWKQKQQVR